MESEKVKEIKKALECCAVHDCSDDCVFGDKHPFACLIEMHKQLLTLINELESEKKRLKKALVDNLKAGYNAGYNDAAGLIDKILNEITE